MPLTSWQLRSGDGMSTSEPAIPALTPDVVDEIQKTFDRIERLMFAGVKIRENDCSDERYKQAGYVVYELSQAALHLRKAIAPLQEVVTCPHDTDNDGDCHLCAKRGACDQVTV